MNHKKIDIIGIRRVDIEKREGAKGGMPLRNPPDALKTKDSPTNQTKREKGKDNSGGKK